MCPEPNNFLAYVHAGFSCVPVRADGSKAAAIPWKEFTTRRPTITECQDWDERYSGVAIIGGAISGNLEVLDIDEPSLVRPFIDSLKSQDVTLPDRLTMVRTPRRNATGNPGCHVMYRCETAVCGNSKLAMSEPEQEIDEDGRPVTHPATHEPLLKPRTLIETRGESGYVLAVGCSPACHPSGNQYEHVYGPKVVDIETLTAAERETIHTAARMFDRSIAETHNDPIMSGYERGGVSPGDSFNAKSAWAEIIEPFGWVSCGESAGIKRWRRPGKATGISATTGILSKTGNELFTVFSTNAYPFEGVGANGRTGVTYSKFGAYATLNHAGDYQAAAQALIRLGYGTQTPKKERKTRVLRASVLDAERRYLLALKAGDIKLVSLGLSDLDKAIGGGVEPGELVIIGGMTSNGKSVLAMQALRTTVESGTHGIMVSHEMGDFAIGKRSLLARCDLAEQHWKPKADEMLVEVNDYWESKGVVFLLHQCRAIADIEREVEMISKEYNLAMVVVDHAQLTQGDGGSRYEQLTDVAARFKDLAVRHNCVCVVPSQMNRQAATNEHGAHQLRDTGAIEEDADVVVLVRWPWRQDKSEHPSRYIIKVEKNRNREIVEYEVECEFVPKRQTLVNKKTIQDPYDEFERFSGPYKD